MATLRYILILATLLSVACSKSEGEISGVNNFPESGSIALSANSRATSNLELTSDRVGLTVDYGTSSPYTSINSLWERDSNGEWSCETNYLWCDESTAAKIYAISPYIENITDASHSVTFSIEADQSEGCEGSDLMSHHNESFVPKSDLNSDGELELELNHLLSQINITISFDSMWDSYAPTIESIYLKDMLTDVEYTPASDEVVTDTSTKADITAYCLNSGSYSVVLPPQTISTTMLVMESTIGDFSYTPSSEITIESGYSYTLSLTVAGEDIVIKYLSVTEYGWKAKTDEEDLGSLENLHVGSLFPNDASPVGVIYKIADDLKSGMVISLTEDMCNWSSASKFAEDLGDEWRLPTIDELEEFNEIYSQNETLRELLADETYGTPITTAAFYWSSDEATSTSAWVHLIYNSSTQFRIPNDKSSENKVRGIIAF